LSAISQVHLLRRLQYPTIWLRTKVEMMMMKIPQPWVSPLPSQLLGPNLTLSLTPHNPLQRAKPAQQKLKDHTFPHPEVLLPAKPQILTPTKALGPIPLTT